jgi:carbonic anhydrase
MASGTTILSFVGTGDVEQLRRTRDLFEEYAASVGVDLCFQSFDEELATLPGNYAPPQGRLLLASHDGSPAGCVGFRRIEAGVCEMKRLYVRPALRGLGIGHLLVDRIIDEAVDAGYVRMRLDTLPSMEAAQELYRARGFREIPPYTRNPVPGALFLELELKAGRL